MKTTTSTAKQFDLSHIRIDEKLQGMRLASFSRRFIAYSIDWIIIWCFTQFLLVIVPLGILFLIVKGRLNRIIGKSRRIIKAGTLFWQKIRREYNDRV